MSLMSLANSENGVSDDVTTLFYTVPVIIAVFAGVNSPFDPLKTVSFALHYKATTPR
jgi:hypothetical protein